MPPFPLDPLRCLCSCHDNDDDPLADGTWCRTCKEAHRNVCTHCKKQHYALGKPDWNADAFDPPEHLYCACN